MQNRSSFTTTVQESKEVNPEMKNKSLKEVKFTEAERSTLTLEKIF